MSKIDTFQCDICHKQKQDANRWWKAFMITGGVIIVGWEFDVDGAHVEYAKTGQLYHLCGEACLHEWLSKNLPAS